MRVQMAVTALAAACAVSSAVGGTFPAVDTAYGISGDGIARPPVDLGCGSHGTMTAAAVQADGSLIVAGTYPVSAIPSDPNCQMSKVWTCVLVRLDPSGKLDPTFGSDPLGQNCLLPAETINRIAIAPDGGILTAATVPANPDGASSIVITRRLQGGTLDTSFHLTGSREFSANAFVGDPFLFGLPFALPLSNGKTLFVATVGSADKICTGILRLDHYGQIDTSFAHGVGSACIQPPSAVPYFSAEAVTEAAAGEILIGGRSAHFGGSGFDATVGKITDGGDLDGTFGIQQDGWAYAPFDDPGVDDGAGALSVDALQRIVIADDSGCGAARLSPGGLIDSAYGVDGFVPGIGNCRAQNAIPTPDGGSIFGGGGGPEYTWVLRRLDDAGAPDPRFGQGGTYSMTGITPVWEGQTGDYLYVAGQDPDVGAAVERLILPLFIDGFEVPN